MVSGLQFLTDNNTIGVSGCGWTNFNESLLQAVSQKGAGPEDEPQEPFINASVMIKVRIISNLIMSVYIQTKIGIEERS
jgi:hypothetical protein